MTTRAAGVARSETLLAAALGGLAALAVAALAPPGGDAAAHLYRTELVREGVRLWDNLWFTGHYPLASYSLLYYLPSSLVGNLPLVIAATVVSAALFAALATHEWGEEAARWPARLFAVVAAGPVFTGTYSYALGVAAGLAALRLLQVGARVPAVGCAALAMGFSPLAFAFLCVALAAALVARRDVGRDTLWLGAAIVAIGGVQLVTVVVFSTEGRYPFSLRSLAHVVAVSVLGALLAARSGRGGPLVPFFVLWALVNVASFLVASPFGDNLARLRHMVLPLVLLACILARFRPRPLAVAALAVALAYNVGPDALALPKRAEDARTAEAAYWRPALSYLAEHAGPEHRVAVVPTFGHWEAYFVPRAGFALARGWYRQLDIVDNPELYRDPLTPAGYRRWLERSAVRYVLLPDARLGPMGASREAELLRSGRAGLVPVHRAGGWTIFEYPGAVPILTGPGRARIERLGHERIEGVVGRAGTYRLRVRYMPYWRVAAGAVCVEPSPDGMTRLVAREAGRFVLAPPERARTVIRAALSEPPAGCPGSG